MIQKSVPHGIIISLILFVCHLTHLGQAAIDEQIFGRFPSLEGGLIQTASHYAVPVLVWFTAWSALLVLANALIFSGKVILYVRSFFTELGNVVAAWMEDRMRRDLYVLLSKAKASLAAEMRRRRGDTT